MWGLESNSGNGTNVEYEDTARMEGDKDLHNLEKTWKNPKPPQRQGAIAEWCTRGGANTVTPSLSTDSNCNEY